MFLRILIYAISILNWNMKIDKCLEKQAYDEERFLKERRKIFSSPNFFL